MIVATRRFDLAYDKFIDNLLRRFANPIASVSCLKPGANKYYNTQQKKKTAAINYSEACTKYYDDESNGQADNAND